MPRIVSLYLQKLLCIIWVVDLYRLIRYPKAQFIVWKDFWKTWNESSFIRREKFPTIKDKVAIMIAMTDSVYELKLTAMAALGLWMRGWHIIVLTNSPYNVWSHRYFKAFGMNYFIYWDNFDLTPQERKHCREEATTILSQGITFQSLKSLTYRNCRIGSQILSAFSRAFKQGAFDIKDPLVKERIQKMLPKVIEVVYRSERLIEQWKPNMVVLIEANYEVMGPFVDMANHKGVSVVQMVQPYRDDAMIFKRLTPQSRRYHPVSISPSTFTEILQSPWTAEQEADLQEEFIRRYNGKWFLQSRNQPNVHKRDRLELFAQLNLDPTKNVAIVFSHLLWDANLFYGEDLFEDYVDWFIETVRAACGNPGVNWILKLHPANIWKRRRDGDQSELTEEILLREKIGPLPNHVKVVYPNTDISTFSLFEIADYGVTVRGTVGIELPCFGVLTLTAGTGRYSGMRFTNDSTTKMEYLKKLSNIQNLREMSPEQILLAKRYAHALFFRRPWVMRSFKSVFQYLPRGAHPLDHNLLLRASSMQEITKNGDLEKWATWAEDKGKVDYLDA